MNFYELEEAIIQWGADKGILEKGTPIGQAIKTLEETTELLDAINKDDKHEIKDASGDIVVTLILQCKMQNISLVECLQQAYDVISKRTGQMKDGIFIKDN